MKNRCPNAAKALLLGLITAQIIATVQVYTSNRSLYQTLSAVRDAGYLAVPSQHLMPSLLDFSTAFFGGLFFTLSVGAGLSIVSLASAWVWARFFQRNTIFLIPWIIPWLALLFLVNSRGLCFMASLYFLIIPPVVFLATSRGLAPHAEHKAWVRRIGYIAPIPLLALLWSTQMDSHLFIDLRDHILLSNSFGIRVNDFYYDYTLYPAEVFKSLDQKTLKTCYLGNLQKKPAASVLERELIHGDYLILDGNGNVDLILKESGRDIIFDHKGKEVLRTPLKKFLANPRESLKEFSDKTDSYPFFRKFTFYSLLIGFPITLYLFFHALFCVFSSLFFDSNTSTLISSSLCFLLGIALLTVLYLGKDIQVQDHALAGALQARDWQERVAALRTIERKKLDIGDFPSYESLLKSPNIPDRYWLARALGISRKPETYSALLGLLDDPSPNAATMALQALGQRGDPKAIREILKRIQTSDHWYYQWYAYKALKALGWKQSKSP